MHFQVIKDDFYNRILEKVKDHFPSFNSVFDKEDGIYPIMGELGTFIIENINQEEVKIQTKKFINKAIEIGGIKTENVIVLQLFQKFYEDEVLSDKVKELLDSKTVVVFDKYLKEYRRE
jgi:hypothetical protein